MASVLDHQHFRETQDNLQVLHDEWMHNSTGTPLQKQGSFEFASGPATAQDINLFPHTQEHNHGVTLGFSPSDMGEFIQRNSLSTPDITGGNPGGGDNSPPGTGGGWGNGLGGGSGSGSGNGGSGGGIGGGGSGKPPTTGKTIIIKKGGKGGSGAQGANAIPLPQLGNVPYSAQSASSTSPTVMILVLGGGVLVIYFIWHKLRKSKAEDKEMDKKGE